MLPVTASPTPPPSPTPQPSADERVDEDGDRISVTDVNGTVARFEMSYEPAGTRRDKTKFGPPVRSRIPSALYLGASIVFGIVTAYAYSAPPSSKLFVWAVEGDRIRPLSVSVVAIVLLVSALATVIRTHMRGVIVADDWIEARYLLPLGVPRVRRWAWAQIHRMVIDDRGVMLEMWTGEYEKLPAVARQLDLAAVLELKSAQHGVLMTRLKQLD